MQKSVIRTYFLAFWTSLLSATCFGQTTQIDSLKTVLDTLQVDTARAQVFNSLSSAYWYISLDSAELFAQEAYSLVDGVEGNAYLRQKAVSHNNIGVIHWFRGEYPEAMKQFHLSLDIYEALNMQISVASAINNIALIYNSQKNFKEAIAEYQKALAMYIELDSVGMLQNIAVEYGNIGSCYRELGELDLALSNVLKAAEIGKATGATGTQGNNLMEAGRILTEMGRFEDAKRYLAEALEVIRDINSNYYLGFCYYNMSNLADSLGNLDQVIDYGELAYDYALKADAKDVQVDITKLLAKAYAEKKRYQKAYEAHLKMVAVRDILYNEDKDKEIHKLEIERKDAAIQIEKQKNELQEAQHERKNLIIFSISGALISAIVLAVLFFRGRQREKKSNTLLAKQKQEIILQNEELQQQSEEIASQRDFIEENNKVLNERNVQITKSITAAKLIQQAILPFQSRVSTYLPNYFVMYHPKDIVSGDFYWINKIEDTIIVAAVDCTGHGVPGAFMSMIGSTLLDDIITIAGVLEPAAILRELNRQVIRVLNQEDSHDLNGMDIALISMNYLENGDAEVRFSGAKRPLYYFEKETNRLEVVKGTNKAIGGRQNEKVFEESVLNLKKGTMLYLASDGLEDQHNQKQKKIGRNGLMKLLNEYATQDVEVQQERLEAHFKRYMNGVHQRDDVLLIGVRV
ncbi:MAG: tetratricopeptide repeat protein [Flammeovirgaceae bacterium]